MISQPSMRVRDWQSIAKGGVTLTANKPSGFGFDWPSSPQDVKYLLVPYVKPITTAMLVVTGEIKTTGAVSFLPTEGPGNGHVHAIVCRKDWNLGGVNGRWWSNPVCYMLTDGGFRMQIPFTYWDWTNVAGQRDADALEATLAAPGSLGLTFGGTGNFGHGVGVQGGTARFDLKVFQLA